MSRKPPAKEKFKAPLEGTPKFIRPPSQRILYLVLALVTVFLLVGGYLFYHFQEQEMRQRIESGLSIVAQLKADQIAQWRAERLTDADILMASPFLIEGVVKYMASPADTGLRDEIIASLASIEKSYPYRDVLLVDLNGSVVLNLNESVNLLGDMTLAQLAVAIEEHKAVMTDFYYPPGRDSAQMDVIAPLFRWQQDSQPIGAVVLCIEPSQYLYPLVQSWPIPSETAETYLVERDGDQVLFLNELRHQKDTALKLRIPLSQQEVPAVMAVLGKEGVVQGKDYRGVEVLAALKHIPDSPWYMVTKIDASEALSAWLFQAGIIVVFVAGLLAFALAATGFVWQRRQRRAYQALYQAEIEAQALRSHFEYLVRYANDIIILTDEDQHIIEANDRALETYDYRREEMLGMPMAALIPPGGFSSYQARLRKLQKEGTVVAEAIHQCQDGSTFPVEVSARSIEIEGKPYIQEIIRNITERKQAEHEKSAILTAMSEHVVYQDLQHRVLWANKAAAESVGLAPEDLVGRYCYEVWQQRSLPCENCPVAQARETGMPQEHEASSPDGRFWLVRGYPVPGTDGSFSGAIEVTQEITERKRAEEALIGEATRRRILMDQSRDGISILDENSKLVEANQRFAKMLGYTSEEMRDFHTWDWDAKWKREELLEMGRGVDEPGVYLETRHRRKDGTLFDVELSVNSAVVAGKKLLFCVSRDVTERRQAEEALCDSEARHRALFETMVQGVVYQDAEGPIISANPAAERILGLTLDQMMGRTSMDPHWKAIHEDGSDFRGDTHPSMLALKTGKPVMNVVMGVFNPALNKHVWININAIPHFLTGESKPYKVYTTFDDITERKQAEEALRLSEQNFRDSMEKSPLGIRILDEDGEKTLYANRAFLDMWGYSSIGELEVVPRRQRYVPECYDEHMEILEKRRRGEPAPLNYELSIVRGDGQVRTLSLSRGEALWGGEKRFQLVYQDVTERKRAEEAMRESEERYRFLVELSPEAIFVASEGKHVFANSAGLKLLGASSPDQIIGKPVADVIHPDYREIVANRMREAIETGIEAPVLEEKFIRLDGTVIDVEVRGAPLVYQGKRAIQVFISDITERKRAEEALHLSERNFRDSIENSPLGIRIADKDGKTIYANRALLDMWGYSSVEELEAVPRKQRYTPDSYDEHRTRIYKRKRGEPAPLNYELNIVRSDGQVRILSVSRGELLWGGEKVFQLVYQDITELKLAAEELEKAVEELQRSNAELERFAYVASHDLQEPLRMVSSYTQLLERRYKDKLDADANDFINYAVGGVSRMQELINDLLLYSRVGTRAKPFERTDMEAVLKASLDNLQVFIEENKAKISHDPLPTLMADEGQMVQVLQNLISNAVKFRGEKSPRIRVSAEQRDSEWVFSVKDNGIGIEPQYFERIFLIFQRLHRDEYPGTGAGLAIAKKIIERHGGRMWIESQPGKGSTFYFSIQATGMRQQATGKRQQARGNRQQAGGGRQQAGGKRQEATGRRQEARGNRQAARGVRQKV